MHLKFQNVNRAFDSMILGIHDGSLLTDVLPSRYGEVIRINEPVTITYRNPRERVLFNQQRDANCFFHLFEALWMLAGRNDLAPIVYYNSKMAEFSDDGGVTQPDAYGHRWRRWFGWDQLPPIIEELKNNPSTRRVVLSMWDPMRLNWLATDDFYKATHGSKGVPCNTHAYFEIDDGGDSLGKSCLHMTVCNRSNDMIWGMFGANVVHFSMLQEYIANCVGVEVGYYHQFTNNLHVYTERWTPQKWIDSAVFSTNYREKPNRAGVSATEINLVDNQDRFDKEVKLFIDTPFIDFKEPFLEQVAKPMCRAFSHHKARQYDLARDCLNPINGNMVLAQDWRQAGLEWLDRKETAYREKACADKT